MPDSAATYLCHDCRLRGTISNFLPCISGEERERGGGRTKKKGSREGGGRGYYGEEEDETDGVTCSVTHSLESAVR